MKVLVATPTRSHGGLDVNYASLCAQVGLEDHSLYWMILDELYDERRWEVWDILEEADDQLADVYYQRPPQRRPGMVNNLASCYNMALALARKYEFDVVVSMQDYFWLPPFALARFLDVLAVHPHSLVTGLASLSSDPGPESVADPQGGWTVYHKPFDYLRDEPQVIEWPDCRADGGETELFHVKPIGWELNWAAIGPGVLRTPLVFDTAYERGVAYDNQDFAIRAAMQHDAELLLDPNNHVIGLPHKAYFPDVEEREAAQSNMAFHLDRWRELQGKGI